MRNNTSAPGGRDTLHKVSELSGVNPLTLRVQARCDGLIIPAHTPKEHVPNGCILQQRKQPIGEVAPRGP